MPPVKTQRLDETVDFGVKCVFCSSRQSTFGNVGCQGSLLRKAPFVDTDVSSKDSAIIIKHLSWM